MEEAQREKEISSGAEIYLGTGEGDRNNAVDDF